jgi:hypothetical protein
MRTEAPTVTPDKHFGRKFEHPAYGTIHASRINGHVNLFGSNVGHDGFIKVEVSGAVMYRDGYSEKIMGGRRGIVEVLMSEAQWVGFVSRMNMGSGTPCTVRGYGTPDGYVYCPNIADPELAAERMEGRIDELHAEHIAHIKAKREEVEALVDGLPAKKRDAILSAVRNMSQHLEANHAYAAKTLREFKEKLVVESKVEIDAMVTDAVGRLGLQSVQQLAQVLAADPVKAMQLLAHQPHEPGDET